MKASPSVSIIGAGNVGSRLAIAFHQANIKVDQICSKTLRHGKQLSRQVNADFTQHIADLKAGSDVYFLCIPDQHFAKFRDAWELQDSLIVHTSGTTPIEILDGISSSYGVFYPLQTFSREHKLSFSNIPVCLEANRPEALELLKILARKITANVSVLTSEQRRWAHLSSSPSQLYA